MSLFVSGCTHHCKGCFNPDQWSFTYGEQYTEAVEEEILEAVGRGYISGLTILGGEPMEVENQRVIVGLLRKVRARFGEQKTVWVYTGCIYERLKGEEGYPWRCEVTDEILSMIDVLVDGPFIEEQKDISLKFRGSANQRVIELRREG